LDITIVLHGLNIRIPYTKFLVTFMIQIFIFSCGPSFLLIYVVKAWACFMHACIHTHCLFGQMVKHCKVAKKSPYPYLTYHMDLTMHAICCAQCTTANGMLVQMLTVLPPTNFKSQCTWFVSADPHGKQAGVQLTFPQPLCISIQIKIVEQQIFLSGFYVLYF